MSTQEKNRQEPANGEIQHFIIGGTIKAATSSLFNSLGAHPRICPSRIKETFFFSKEYSGDTARDHDAYLSYFAPLPECRVLMEASPNYLAFKENVAPRIHQVIPNAKLLFVLRNPVERLFSHFNFAKSKVQLPQDMSFEEFVGLCERFGRGELTPEQAGVREAHLEAMELGHYSRYLKNFFDVFGTGNVKVVFFEEVKNSPVEILKDISEFIGVSPSFYEEFTMNKANVTFNSRFRLLHLYAILFNRIFEPLLRRNSALKHRLVRIYRYFNQNRRKTLPMQEATRRKLEEYYSPGNRELQQLLQEQELPSWAK